MSHIVLVRHGRAAAGWSDHHDPPLDEAGRAQAEAMADALHLFGPMPLVSSPLLRCLETADALGQRWGVDAHVEPRVGEVVAPVDDLEERGRWLAGFMASTWDEQPEELVAWRDGVVEALVELAQAAREAVVVTHFVALNAVVSRATGDPRVTCFLPDHCSRTEVRVEGDRIEVVELGAQSTSRVL